MNSSEIVRLLRRWAEELDIPSGPFVNENLSRAASHIEAQEKMLTELTLERDRLKFVILSSYREMDWELIRAARYALEGPKSLPFKIVDEPPSQKDTP